MKRVEEFTCHTRGNNGKLLPPHWTAWKPVLRKSALSIGTALAFAGNAFAQAQVTSPWENAVNVLQQAFTSPIARDGLLLYQAFFLFFRQDLKRVGSPQRALIAHPEVECEMRNIVELTVHRLCRLTSSLVSTAPEPRIQIWML